MFLRPHTYYIDVVVFFRILSNLYVPSRVYHAKLDVSEVVVHHQFHLTVTIMDRNNLIATNMAWQVSAICHVYCTLMSTILFKKSLYETAMFYDYCSIISYGKIILLTVKF